MSKMSLDAMMERVSLASRMAARAWGLATLKSPSEVTELMIDSSCACPAVPRRRCQTLACSRPKKTPDRCGSGAWGAFAAKRRRSAAIVGVDRHIVVRQVAGPHRGRGGATGQTHPDGDLGLLHHALAIGLLVLGTAATLGDHVHVVQMQLDQALVQVVDAGIAHGRQNAAQVGGRRK